MNNLYLVAIKSEENETEGIIAIACFNRVEDREEVDNLIKTTIQKIKAIKGQMTPEMSWVGEIIHTLKRNGYSVFEVNIDNYFEVA